MGTGTIGMPVDEGLQLELLDLEPETATLDGDVVLTGMNFSALKAWRAGGYKPSGGCAHPLPSSAKADRDVEAIYLVAVDRGDSAWAVISTARQPQHGQCAAALLWKTVVVGTPSSVSVSSNSDRLRKVDSSTIFPPLKNTWTSLNRRPTMRLFLKRALIS